MDAEYDLLKKGLDRLSYFKSEFIKSPCFETQEMQILWQSTASQFIAITTSIMEEINKVRYSYDSLSFAEKTELEQFVHNMEKIIKAIMAHSKEYFDKYEFRYGS